MEQEISIVDNQVVVALSGRVETQQAGMLKDKLLALVGEGQRNFIIDFARVDYIDSAGLGVLVAVRNGVMENNGFVAIKNLNEKLQKLFALTRLADIFTMPAHD